MCWGAYIYIYEISRKYAIRQLVLSWGTGQGAPGYLGFMSHHGGLSWDPEEGHEMA